MTGAIPQYLVPLRNRYGLIGPIPPDRLAKEAIDAGHRRRIRWSRKGGETRAVHSVITNSTYDGLCYNARRVEELLDPSVDRIHFDEAWYAYARFNPLYRDRFAHARRSEGSQGSDGVHDALDAQAARRAVAGLVPAHSRRPQRHSACALQRVVHDACVDLAAVSDHRLERHHARDDGRPRRADAHERVDPGSRRVPADDGPRAPAVRREAASGSSGPGTRTRVKEQVRQEGAPSKTPPRSSSRPIRTAGCCIRARPGTASAISKTATACSTRSRCRSSRPASRTRAASTKRGIPATLVTAYLHYRGVEVEKTTDFTILVLFSIGITQGQVGHAPERAARLQARLRRATPRSRRCCRISSRIIRASTAGSACATSPMQMFAQLRESRQTHWLAEAFSTLPTLAMTPNAAYQHLVRDEIEHVPLEQLADRVLATSVVPYPPGIPMLMPGEVTGAADGPYLGYLRALCAWDKRFPGFGHDTHGVENRDGAYYVQCLEDRRGARGATHVSAAGRKMSLTQATMLVAGNMIGTGVFLLPVNLAHVGGIAIFGWLIATRRRRRARPRVREARRAQSAAGRAVRLRARLPRSLRRLSDELRVLVRQLDRQHRDCGRRHRLSRRADPGDRRRRRRASSPPPSSSGCSRSRTSSARASSARSRPGRWRSRSFRSSRSRCSAGSGSTARPSCRAGT